MEVLKNLRILEDLDDSTATLVIQLALEELDHLLERGRERGKRSEGSYSEAERELERTRDELQRHIRRIANRASSRIDGVGDGASWILDRPQGSTRGRGKSRVDDRPITSSPPRFGEPSSSGTSLPRRSSYVHPTNSESSSSTPRKNPAETRPAPARRRPYVYPSDVESSNSASTNQPAEAQPSPPQNEDTELLDTTRRHTCVVCMEDFIWFYTASLPCGHHYCSTCLTEMFIGATTDESRYPPRCCEPISLELGRPFLLWKVTRDYLLKKEEWDTKDRTYCSNKDCLIFIRPWFIRGNGNDARCPKCWTKTCVKCKKAAHSRDAQCVDDPELQQTLTLITKNRWQRCKDCGAGIERTFGCNEILYVAPSPKRLLGLR
jgi:hypothetical protein